MMTFGKLPALLLNDVAILNLAILCLYFESIGRKRIFGQSPNLRATNSFPLVATSNRLSVITRYFLVEKDIRRVFCMVTLSSRQFTDT